MASKPECHSDHRAVLQPRGAAFARHLTKAASLENYKAPDITPGAYSLSMISCYLRNNSGYNLLGWKKITNFVVTMRQ